MTAGRRMAIVRESNRSYVLSSSPLCCRSLCAVCVCVCECVGATVAISKGEIELGIVFGGVMFLFLSNTCHFLLLLGDIACYFII